MTLVIPRDDRSSLVTFPHDHFYSEYSPVRNSPMCTKARENGHMKKTTGLLKSFASIDAILTDIFFKGYEIFFKAVISEWQVPRSLGDFPLSSGERKNRLFNYIYISKLSSCPIPFFPQNCREHGIFLLSFISRYKTLNLREGCHIEPADNHQYRCWVSFDPTTQ